jgi:NAD(P)H-dependent flavin oxidoreductase YrpB (nitropropane dioxygenase family)
MKTKICEMLGIDFPLFAFSHCRDVVVAVSKAGGFGVLGALAHTPEQLEVELSWIDAHIDGRPYGVDIVVPENMGIRDEMNITAADLLARIPQAHRDYAYAVLAHHGVMAEAADAADQGWISNFMPDTGERTMEVTFRHPVKFVAHALGLPPASLVARAHAAGIPVGALVGSKEHALRQAAAGVDVIIAQGTEAGGHCGEVSTMVLVPEVVRALGPDTPVLAAGGIVTGAQMAAAMTMGAAGVWTGSVWLPTVESELSAYMREKIIAASSRDTVRTRASTGKMCRQLKSDWTEAWDQPGGMESLPMPFQPLLTQLVMGPASKAADNGNVDARRLVNYLAGQGIGMIDGVKSAGRVVQDFKEGFADAVEHINAVIA